MSAPSPQQQVVQMISAYWISQAISVAATLGVADELGVKGPRSADELAVAARCHAPSLHRLLRALASVGLFTEDADHRFALTPLGECLREGVPGSQRAQAIQACAEAYRAFGELLHSVRTGETGFAKVFGASFFDYLVQHPEQARRFDDSMVELYGRETAAMLDAYDLADIGVLADVGGGNGSLLTAALQRHPALRGILVDRPDVVARAAPGLRAAGVADRCQLVGGDFFESVPAGGDVYLLRHILHDWNDAQCTRILGNVRRAMAPHGRVLVAESVIAPGNEPSYTKLLDLTMLVVLGGQERTQADYERLFSASGLRLARVVPTRADVSVLEARA